MIGDLKSLVKLYTKDKNILKEKDELGRNLLYIAARNGFNDICEFLLEEGIIDPNDTQNSKRLLYMERLFMSKYQLLNYYLIMEL